MGVEALSPMEGLCLSTRGMLEQCGGRVNAHPHRGKREGGERVWDGEFVER